jgi:peptidoglycan-associated lipoprotein
MKKVLFGILIIFTAALLTGGTCGGGQEIPEPLPDTDVQTEPDIQPEDTTTVTTQPDITPLETGDFKKVLFDFDKYNIRPDAGVALEFNARLLRDNPDAAILIEGHCDERGTVEYNLALGEKRAKAAMDYLIQLGISGSRLEMVSFGKERPVDLGHNEVSWQKNRRAECNVQ